MCVNPALQQRHWRYGGWQNDRRATREKIGRERAEDVIWRVTAAVETMCVGKGDVRSRLLATVRDELVPLRKEDFPDALRPKFRRMLGVATTCDSSDLDQRFPLPCGKSHAESEGLLGATMRQIQRNTGVNIA